MHQEQQLTAHPERVYPTDEVTKAQQARLPQSQYLQPTTPHHCELVSEWWAWAALRPLAQWGPQRQHGNEALPCTEALRV